MPCFLMANASMQANASQIKQQTQETSININASDLRAPHFLRVTVSGSVTQLRGQIKLDGQSIQTLSNRSTQIDLSPYLSQGTHVLKLSGQYFPPDAGIAVEFTGPHTQVSQEASGSGSLNQTLIIEVR
jgi:hypothetical protein